MNVVTLIGNLTRDPELRTIPSGTSVCDLGVAVNERVKKGDEWVDEPVFVDVTVWGAQADNCAQYLSKGKKVGITGRLRWHSWEAQDGTKRSKLDVTASRVEFLTPKGDGGSGERYEPEPGSTSDDDIPF